jgi:hypothetical protein
MTTTTQYLVAFQGKNTTAAGNGNLPILISAPAVQAGDVILNIVSIAGPNSPGDVTTSFTQPPGSLPPNASNLPFGGGYLEQNQGVDFSANTLLALMQRTR